MTNPGSPRWRSGSSTPRGPGWRSGINSTFRQVGIATGVAALGAIFQTQIDSKLSELLPQAPPAFAEAVSSGGARQARSHRCRRSSARKPPTPPTWPSSAA